MICMSPRWQTTPSPDASWICTPVWRSRWTDCTLWMRSADTCSSPGSSNPRWVCWCPHALIPATQFLLLTHFLYINFWISADLQRIRRVHRWAVQASPPAWWLWGRVQICLEDNCATAGEHDPPLRGHGTYALLWWGTCKDTHKLHSCNTRYWKWLIKFNTAKSPWASL